LKIKVRQLISNNNYTIVLPLTNGNSNSAKKTNKQFIFRS